MSHLIQSSPQVDAYLADFERLVSRVVEPSWLRNLRRRGIEHFGDLGFPTTREEEWRFTSVAPIADRHFTLVHRDQSLVTADRVEGWARSLGGCRLVLVNGVYEPRLSGGDLPAGVQVSSLASVLAANPTIVEPYLARLASPDRQAFTALNTGFLQDGAFVWIPPDTIVDEPVVLLFVSASSGTASVTHPRILIVAGDNSQVRIVEGYVGSPERGVLHQRSHRSRGRVRCGGRSSQGAAREPSCLSHRHHARTSRS